MNFNKKSPPLEITYVGVSGVSGRCITAVQRYIAFGDKISNATILTAGNGHCLLLVLGDDHLVAVKSGFRSGYIGEGPRALEYVLRLLDQHGVSITERSVPQEIIRRVDECSLTLDDLELIENASSPKGSHWLEYVERVGAQFRRDAGLWEWFPATIPYSVIDQRLIGVVQQYQLDPDAALLNAYRRLEDTIRDRTGLEEHGAKLFSQAFQGSSPKLVWLNIDSGERTGRSSLFAAIYMAYRNPRAHREFKSNSRAQLMELMLVNCLFLLEAEAVMNPDYRKSG